MNSMLKLNDFKKFKKFKVKKVDDIMNMNNIVEVKLNKMINQ